MVTFLRQSRPTGGNRFVDFRPLGEAVSGAIEESRERSGLAGAGDVARQGGTGEAIANALIGSKSPRLQAFGLDRLVKEREAQSASAEREAARVESRERFDISTGIQRENIAQSRRLTDAKIASLDADAKRLAASGGFKDLNEKAKFAQGVRKEIAARSGDFIKVRDAFNRIDATSDNAAGDLALIFNFMKMLDPGSVVRESEFATAQNAAGVPDRIRAQWNQLLAGERLAPKTRKEFRGEAKSLFASQQKTQSRLIDSFGRIAGRVGIDQADIFADLEVQSAPENEAPSVPGSLTTPGGLNFRVKP